MPTRQILSEKYLFFFPISSHEERKKISYNLYMLLFEIFDDNEKCWVFVNCVWWMIEEYDKNRYQKNFSFRIILKQSWYFCYFYTFYFFFQVARSVVTRACDVIQVTVCKTVLMLKTYLLKIWRQYFKKKNNALTLGPHQLTIAVKSMMLIAFLYR